MTHSPSLVRTITRIVLGKTSILVLAFCAFFLIGASDIGATHEEISDQNSSRVAQGLALLCCIALLWLRESLPLAVTSLLVPVLAASSGLMTMHQALLPFADPLIFMFLGGFALAAALRTQMLDLWLAQHLLRWGQGRFFRICLLLFFATAALSMWMNNTATTAMMIPIALSILHRIPIDDRSASDRIFLLLGLAYAAGIGGMGTLIGSPPNAIAAAALDLSFGAWMLHGLPAVFILLPLMIGILSLTLRPNWQLRLSLPHQPIPLDRPRQITLTIFSLTIASWMFGSWIGPRLGIHAIDSWIALVSLLLLCLTRVVSWSQIQQEVDWGILLLFGGGLALSAILKQSGASHHLAHLLGHSMDDFSLPVMLAIAIGFAMVSATFTSNTGSAALLIPIFSAIAAELSISASQLVIPIALASSCSFLLPISTPPNALVYSSGHVPQSMMIKNGLIVSVVSMIVLLGLSLANSSR